MVGIIGVLAGIGTRTYINERRRFSFNDSLARILSMIQTARHYAVTSRAAYFDQDDDGDKELVIPPEGYGVYIKKSEAKLTLFANTGADPNLYEPGEDFVEETYTLPNETVLVDLLKNDKDTVIDNQEALVLFRPPFGTASISDNLGITIDTLYLKLSYLYSPPAAPKRFIHINQTAGFPELESNE